MLKYEKDEEKNNTEPPLSPLLFERRGYKKKESLSIKKDEEGDTQSLEDPSKDPQLSPLLLERGRYQENKNLFLKKQNDETDEDSDPLENQLPSPVLCKNRQAKKREES